MKRFFLFVLVLFSLFVFISCDGGVQPDKPVGPVTPEEPEEPIIPDDYPVAPEGKTVFTIEDFKLQEGYPTTCIVPEGYLTIDSRAFRLGSCKSVILPSTVRDFVNTAFLGINIESFTVSPSNEHFKSVDGVLFSKDMTKLYKYPSGKKGQSYTIPDSVISLEQWAFCECQYLDIVVIPNSVKTVENGAFRDCALKRIDFPASVVEINEGAFWESELIESINVEDSNPNFKSIDGVLYSKDGTEIIAYPAGKDGDEYSILEGVANITDSAFVDSNLKRILIPNSVKRIDVNAFRRCLDLLSIEIPDSVEYIGGLAFGDCRSLQTINIPSGVNNLYPGAFDGCKNLSSITVDSLNETYKAIDNVIFSKDGTALLSYFSEKNESEYTIPNTVTLIGNDAFYSCKNLKEIYIPTSVEMIGRLAFFNCGATSIIYNGTKSQWNTITRISNSRWNERSSIEKVICSDGEIVL